MQAAALDCPARNSQLSNRVHCPFRSARFFGLLVRPMTCQRIYRFPIGNPAAPSSHLGQQLVSHEVITGLTEQ
jgi:hypothetical protein